MNSNSKDTGVTAYTGLYTISNSRAKAEVAGVLGQWWLNFEPFLIKNPV